MERTKDGVRVGIPVQLFELNAADNVRILDVSTDGQKILASRTRGGKSESPISLVLNWEKVAEKK